MALIRPIPEATKTEPIAIGYSDSVNSVIVNFVTNTQNRQNNGIVTLGNYTYGRDPQTGTITFSSTVDCKIKWSADLNTIINVTANTPITWSSSLPASMFVLVIE